MFGMVITKYDPKLRNSYEMVRPQMGEVVSYKRNKVYFYVLKHGDVISFDSLIYVVFLRFPDQGKVL